MGLRTGLVIYRTSYVLFFRLSSLCAHSLKTFVVLQFGVLVLWEKEHCNNRDIPVHEGY